MRATDLMDELASTRSTIEDRTAQQIADHWLNALVAVAERASTQPSGAPSHRSEVAAVRFALTADRYLTAGGRADITFVFATNGAVDYAVLDYSETAPEARAQRVLSGQLAQRLWNWLDTHFSAPDPAPGT